MTTTLVVGGTGKTGRRVAERLRERGMAVRIGSRLLSFADAAGEISAAAGLEVRYVPVSPAEFAAAAAWQGVPEAEVDIMKSLVREYMELVHPLSVPLRVEIGVGPNWRDLD